MKSSRSKLPVSVVPPHAAVLRLHGRWLRYAGGEAQSALEAATRALIRPRVTLLDVGCGTGAFARRLSETLPASVALTLLDRTLEMLERCAEIDAYRVQGRLENLPFAADSFDLVTCGWALETTDDPMLAIDEMKRVTRKGGAICVMFCAENAAGGFAGTLLKHAIKLRRIGAFLHPDVVCEALAQDNAFDVSPLPCRGPAAVLLARCRRGQGDIAEPGEAKDARLRAVRRRAAPCAPSANPE